MRSIRVKVIAFITSLLVMLLLLLNFFPITASRDRIFAEKRNSLYSTASTLASSLLYLDNPNEESISEVLHLLDVSGFERLVVADGEGRLLYDDRGQSGSMAQQEEIRTALEGKTVFRSRFSQEAFQSSFAMPMYDNGTVVGAVYISELDRQQAQTILAMQSRISTLSMIIAGAALVVSSIFAKILLGRIYELVQSMRIVAAGDYAHRLPTRGQDEITELGEEFNILTERLETTEKQRRRFVSDASHELKTPLASIRLLSDSIVQSEDMDREMLREFVTDIGQEAMRLQRTTEMLLDLSRLDDQVQIVPEPVDVKQVAVDAMVLLRPLAEQRKVRIRTELDDGCVVMATVDDMFHIIFNLMENAIKYNVEGGSVFLSLHSDDTNVRFTVEDTGIGIPEEDMFNIFSRFYRVDKARSREAGGSGLGLSIVHDAVQLHGGTVAVGANKPQGARFIVSFPKPTPEETGI